MNILTFDVEERYNLLATDSQYMKDHIKLIDRETHEITEVQEVQSPVTNSVQFCDWTFVAPCVEPSKVNQDKEVFRWSSKDGKK